MAISVTSLGGSDVATLGFRISGLQAFDQAAAALNKVTSAGERAQAGADKLGESTGRAAKGFALSEQGANRLAASMGPLAGNLANVNPQVANLVRTIGMMGIGGPVMVGAIAAAGALGVAYDTLTTKSRALEEQIQKSIAALQDMARAESLGITGETGRGLADLKARQEDIKRLVAEQSHQLIDPSIPKIGIFPGRKSVEDLKEEYRQNAETIRTMEGVVSRIIQDAADQRQRDAAAAYAKHLQAMRDYVQGSIALARAESAAWKTEQDAKNAAHKYDLMTTPIDRRDMSSAVQSTIHVPDTILDSVGKAFQRGSETFMDRVTEGFKYEVAPMLAESVAIRLGNVLGGGGASGSISGGMFSGMAQGGLLGSRAGPEGMIVGMIVGGLAGLVTSVEEARRANEEYAASLRQAKQDWKISFDDLQATSKAKTPYTQGLESFRQQFNAVSKDFATTYQLDAYQNFRSTDSLSFWLQRMQDFEERIKGNAEAMREWGKVEQWVRDQIKELAEAERQRVQEMRQDLLTRSLSATGSDYLAGRFGMVFSQKSEWEKAIKAGEDDTTLQFLKFVQETELKNYDLNESVRWQTELIQKVADAQLRVLDEQLSTAREAQQIAQEQLRAQEQTVSSLRNVVDSLTGYSNELKVGSLSTLSPIQQLQSARTQFEGLYALALGGDVTAAQSIPGAGNTLLGLSRGYNASGAGYVTDFNRVSASTSALLGKYGPQLSVEERVLKELENQSSQLNTQIQQLGKQIETTRAEAQRQIEAVNAAAAAEKEKWIQEQNYYISQIGWLRDLYNDGITFRAGDGVTIPGYPSVPGAEFPGGSGTPSVSDYIRTATEKTATATEKSAADTEAIRQSIEETGEITFDGFNSVIQKLGEVSGSVDRLREDMLYRYGP